MIGYLHIGTLKTGSTSIQQFLHANRGYLLARHYLYPACIMAWQQPPFPNHNAIVRHSLDAVPQDLLDEIRSSACRRLIISAESLVLKFTTAEQIAALRTFMTDRLGCQEVRVIVYLRETGSLFASMCSQSIKAGDTEFEQLPARDNHRFRLVADARAILQAWGEVFGYEQLRVRLFERDSFPDGSLLHDFAQAIELPWDKTLAVPSHPLNASFNLLQIELLRRMHLTLSDNPEAEHLRYFIYSVLNRHLRKCGGPELRYYPPRARVAEHVAYYAEANEWVRRRFFPQRSTLFARQSEPDYPENHELKTMQPAYWESLATLIRELATQNYLQQRLLQSLQSGGHQRPRSGTPAMAGTAPRPLTGMDPGHKQPIAAAVTVWEPAPALRAA